MAARDKEVELLVHHSEPDCNSTTTKPQGTHAVLLAGLCYSAAAGSMLLLNKHALHTEVVSFTAPNALLCFQCALAVLLVRACSFAGLIHLQPLRWDIATGWCSVSLMFMAMRASSLYALQHSAVGTMMVWRNLSNVATAMCDVACGKHYSSQLWLSLVLMVLSAAASACNDLVFSWQGCGWQLVSCACTTAYVVYLRAVMDKVAGHTPNTQRLDVMSMVFYHNLLLIPPLLALMVLFGEHRGLLQQPGLQEPMFMAIALLGGLIGFGMSFSALWLLSLTTATIYSLVGALKHVLVAAVGIWALSEPASAHQVVGVVVGLWAGVLFVFDNSRGQG